LPNDRHPSPAILEVGCAAGVALSVFREYGWQTSGIEPADMFASYARDSFGLDVRTGFYGSGSFDEQTFDLIMFSQVLEHVPDPDTLLVQARRNLADDGHVFIGIPTLMRPMRPVHPMTLQAIHLWIFSMPTLRLLLERNGLTPVACTYDQKGLMVLARKAAECRHWRAGAGDSAERVKRYFADFTASDSLYAKNLASLYSVGKDYGRPPDLDADLSTITVEAVPEGYLNLCERQDGGERWFYGADPRGEAERLGRQFDFGIEGVVVLLGLGLGYLAQTILSKLQRGHSLVICEADPRIFHAAMFHQDLTPLLKDPRVHLVVGELVMGPVDAEVRKRPLGCAVANHEARNPGLVAGEREHDEVQHGADVAVGVSRCAQGPVDQRALRVRGGVHALFELTKTGQVLVELPLVRCAEPRLEPFRVVDRHVEDR
jgi:SAM-dependent methyltransferase